MHRVAIVGGGISGLAAAYKLEKLRQDGTPVEYTLFESSSHLGGVIQTEHRDGYVIEAGADSFLSAKSWARDLCDEIGLGDQLIHSRDHERRTYIVVRNQLVAIPDGMQFMVPTSSRAVMTSRVFSVATKLRFVNEYLNPAKFRKNPDDESVESFVARHFGHEVVDRLAEPLLAGVYGGEASSMSVRAVLPMMVRMEEEHGSLIRAALAARRTRSGGKSEPLFTTLRGGMGEMVRALVSKLPPNRIRTSSPVRQVAYQDGWRISVNERNEQFDALILAVPAYSAAALLRRVSASADGLANELEKIQYTSSIAVAFGYKADDVARAGAKLPSGFGFLVPRSERRRMLACTFVHQKFEHRVPEGRLLLRAFFGGKRNQDLMGLPDSDLIALAHGELRDILRWDFEPELTRVYRSSRAMAQYHVGHLDRMTTIQRLCSDLPNFHLAGNAYQGIGIPDCIRSGEKAALAILKTASVVAT
ncbi:MAG TPA: protoporphyrinogen oxidase [Terriglobales bacterium]